MNPMIQFLKQLTGKMNPNLFTSVMNNTSGEKLAYIRQLQREMKKQEILEIPFSELPVVVFDLETTGFYPSKGDRILSIGAVKMTGEHVQEEESFYSLVHSNTKPASEIEQLTGITFEQLQEAPPLHDVLADFFAFVQSSTLVAHHANHERNFMQQATWSALRTRFEHRIIDTAFLTKIIGPVKQLITLDDCCDFFGIKITKRHHALHDAEATAQLWAELLRLVQKHGYVHLKDAYTHLAKL
ncbi:DNA polymerase-3 subunit epsilon [Evansella caseinilytica]|uniref:DNA polymerase-3 subunit epsilon n=1 Tax=Evansella caseinilytica TaxID=1503961 RepID=A0A1H3NW01_9BACI|nr:exonuclease domain-containing protein [Evansella caseinilytica]SDY93044.1 DNA polymerase-3 subunit epsilon [Evansella caseinilytica]